MMTRLIKNALGKDGLKGVARMFCDKDASEKTLALLNARKKLPSPHRSMDRISPSEGEDVGSIPTEGTL